MKSPALPRRSSTRSGSRAPLKPGSGSAPTRSRSISISPATPTWRSAWTCPWVCISEKFPAALHRKLDHGFLAPLAHQPVAMAARLSLHPVGRQPRVDGRNLSKSLARLPALRALARRELDLRGLGRASRLPSRHRARRPHARARPRAGAGRATLRAARRDDRLGLVSRPRFRPRIDILCQPRWLPWLG